MDKRVVPFIIIILVVSQLSFAYGADYGENSTCLGQVTDDYENDDYLNATINVIRNNSLTCMELIKGAEIPIIEDFSTYTEVDSANRIVLINNTCVWHRSQRNEEYYLYKNYGAKTFFEYDVTFEVYVDNYQSYARAIPFMLSNGTGGQKRHIDNAWGYTCVYFYMSTSPPRYAYMYVRNSTYTQGVSKSLYPVDDWLYCRVRQNETHVAFWIYTDKAHTVLWWYVDIEFSPEYYSKVYSANGYMTSGGNAIEYYNKNMSLFVEGGYGDGHYYTEDMMNGSDGGTLVHLTNVTLPANTGITVEYSEDNATWKTHLGDAGGDSLDTGFYSLDLRNLNYTVLYQRFNLTTTDGSVTPRIYQSRIITTYYNCTNGGGGVITFLFYPLIVYGIVVIFLITIALVLAKKRS